MNTEVENKLHQGSNGSAHKSAVTLQDLEQLPKDSLKSLSSEQLSVQKLMFLHSLNMLNNFHRVVTSSRRSSRQRISRRCMMMRSFYIRQMSEIQDSYFLRMPAFLRQCMSSAKKNNNESQLEDTGSEKNETLAPRFYEDVVSSFSPMQWLATFRVSRKTFHWLCVQLKDALKALRLNMPQKISLEKGVALSLYVFANGVDYSEVATRFEVSRTSVCKLIKSFAEVIINVLGSHLLALPTTLEEYDEIRHNFQTASNMPPLVVGVLGQCEMPVNPVSEEIAIYQNESDNKTLFLQAIVDDKLLIREILIGPQCPNLFLKDIVTLPHQIINGRELPCFVVAPSSFYALCPWLLHQYDFPINPHQHDFNDAMDQLLEFKDKAFRRLFGRWHILQRKLEPETKKKIAAACCVLHNLLEENYDAYMEEWESDLDMAQYTNIQLACNAHLNFRYAVKMRDFLASTISSTEI